MIPSERLQGITLSTIRQIMAKAPEGSINLALGELGYPFPDLLRNELCKLISESQPAYTPNGGLLHLRERIRGYYGNIPSIEQICVTNGAEEAIFLLMQSYINPGDKVAIPDPDYSAYNTVSAMMKAQVLRLPFENDLRTIDWDLWDDILSHDVKLLVMSNPQNPSGNILSDVDIVRLINLCKRYNISLAIDEIYRDLVYYNPYPSILGMYDNCFVISGLSKSHLMSGFRIGWLISPPPIAASVITAKQYVSTCSSWISQSLADFALSEIGMQVLPEIISMLIKTQTIIETHLKGLKWVKKLILPNVGPYVMIQIEEDSQHVCEEIASKGVIMVPGRAFGDVAASWIRINHAIPETKLKEALKIIISQEF